MRQPASTMFAIAIGILVSTGAHAQDDKSKAMDANRDGMVSAAEHDAGAKAMFEQMDADHDGNVTPTEMDTAHAAMDKSSTHGNEMTSEDKIRTIDSNGDGVISTLESSAGSKMMFQKMDTDGNGSVSPQEMDAAEAAMKK